MKPLEIEADASEVYHRVQADYRETLVAPQDDMWAAFADGASHHALRLRGEIVGCAAVNAVGELMFLHLDERLDAQPEAIFAELITRLELVAATPSTVDPAFLSLCLDAGRDVQPRALMFRHVVEPVGEPLENLRRGDQTDRAAAIAFVEGATGMPTEFLEPYLGERIERGQLLVYEEDGLIVATGECRNDERQPGYAHVGLIVGRERRGQGLGGRVMHSLVVESRGRGLRPLCSTEPDNLAALRVIHRAGFRGRHRVYRVAFN